MSQPGNGAGQNANLLANQNGAPKNKSKQTSLRAKITKGRHSFVERCREILPLWWRRWWLQLSATFLGIGCLLANVGILYSIDGKPLQVHKIFDISISPNTLISIFSTITSASLMFAVGDCLGQLKWTFFQQRAHRLQDLQVFDDASRGPLGSAVLLWKLNIKAFIASIGALITIAALANDPFTQALLSFPKHLVRESNGVALIPRSQVYLGGGAKGAAIYSFLSNGFYRGLFTPSLQVQYTCDSGHCEWPAFQSLAFCSDCSDITNVTEVHCSPPPKNSALMSCNFTTPLTSDLYNNFTVEDGYVETEYFIASSAVPANTKVNQIGNQGQMVWASVLQFEEKYNFNLNASHYSALRPKALQCSLSWCMKTYSPKFENGQLQDNVVNSSELTFTKDGRNKVWVDSAFAQLWPGVVGSEFPSNFDGYAAYASNQSGVFWVNGGSLLGFWGQLVSALSVTTLVDGLTEGTSGNPVGAALHSFNHGNISQTFEQIATGLTDAVRQAAGSTQVRGHALVPETFVRVNWPWIAFPGSVVLFTAIFVTFSVVFSFEKGEVIWKSSSIALLFHGLHGWTEQELDVQNLEKMEEKAEEMNVLLSRGNGGRMAFVKS